MKKTKTRSFRIGDVFQHCGTNNVPQHYGDKFRKYLLDPAQDRVISINTALQSLQQFILQESMNDTEIQHATGSRPMDEETFWCTYYLLIIKPELGSKILGHRLHSDEECIIHVRLDSGTVWSIGINRYISEWWGAGAYGFDHGRSKWRRTRVFLFFPKTVKK